MGSDPISLLAAGFTIFDVLFLIGASLVAALAMRRWRQLTGAVFIAYAVDVSLRFAMEYLSAGDMPANFALELAFARLDMHALAATLKPFLYFGAIALLFGMKRRYGAR
jgi:hypothetical protein